MSGESGLFIEDLEAGREAPGGRIADGLELSPADFAGRFGALFWRPPESLDPIYYKLAAFCKTTAVSENSPANLGATGVLFHRPPTSLADQANTVVLGRKFRAPGASTGVAQVQSRIGPPGGAPTLRWTRECVVKGRPGWRLPESAAPLDTREAAAAECDLSAARLPEARGPVPRPPGARVAEDFRVGEVIPAGRIALLRPDEVLWLTRGLGNLAKTHYTRDSGYIVWGLLTLLYGVHNHAPALQCAALLGMDQAKHLAPVYLCEALRAEEHAAAKLPEPPEFLSATLTPLAQQEAPGRPDLRLVTVELLVTNHINAIGRAEYQRQGAKKAIESTVDGLLLVGRYVLRLAVFTRAATRESSGPGAAQAREKS